MIAFCLVYLGIMKNMFYATQWYGKTQRYHSCTCCSDDLWLSICLPLVTCFDFCWKTFSFLAFYASLLSSLDVYNFYTSTLCLSPGKSIDTAIHLAEAAFIFNQPTIFLPPSPNEYGPQYYTYRPNDTDWCPADDWTCYVYPLTSCEGGGHSTKNSNATSGEWRAPFMYFWIRKYLEDADKENGSEFLDTWNMVVNGLGNGNREYGIRGLAMIVRRWATRPLPWLQREVAALLAEQGLERFGEEEGNGTNCTAIHLRRSDSNEFSGRPIFSLNDTLEVTRSSLYTTNPKWNNNILLLSDTEVEEGIDPSWTALRRYRGGSHRGYSDHLPTKNATIEVINLYAELELASMCTTLTYQQGAFAGLLWDVMCHHHGGWGVCVGNISKVAMCDMCCKKADVEAKLFDRKTQTCRNQSLPEYACGTIQTC